MCPIGCLAYIVALASVQKSTQVLETKEGHALRTHVQHVFCIIHIVIVHITTNCMSLAWP